MYLFIFCYSIERARGPVERHDKPEGLRTNFEGGPQSGTRSPGC